MTFPDTSAPKVADTYLEHCQKDGRLIRWSDAAMPLQVYIAPFTWHEKSKQQNGYNYQAMVQDGFRRWSDHSGGRVRFQFVHELRHSQINVLWRRVDRKTLGHCEYAYSNRGELYSAEIQIGLTDGLVHPQYNSMAEVQHTVIHEIAHALGIAGHSPHSEDIMFVPHQYGVSLPSDRDVATLSLLYRLPVGFDYAAVAQQLKLEGPVSFNRAAAAYLGEPLSEAPVRPPARKPLPNQTQALFHQQDILTQINKFYVQTQHVQVRQDVKHLYIQRKPLSGDTIDPPPASTSTSASISPSISPSATPSPRPPSALPKRQPPYPPPSLPSG